MADFITPWMAEHSGPRLVDLDIQKGQEAMSQIDLRKAQAENQRAQTELRKDQLKTQILTQQALMEMSRAQAGNPGALDESQGGALVDGDTPKQTSFNTGGNHLWKMSQILAPINPKLSGTLANQASQIDRRQFQNSKDVLRSQQIAAQTMSERFDLAGRRFNGVQTMDDLIDAARYYEEATGMKSGILGPNGEPPTVNFRKGGVPTGERDIEAENRFAQIEARKLAEGTMKSKDALAAQSREARDAVYTKDVANRQAHQEWQRNVDKQRELAEARRKAAGAKEGEKSLNASERKEGADFIKAIHPNIDPPERAKQLGDELMDTAKRMMADPNRRPGLTMTEAKHEAYKKLRADGRLAGVPGSGRSAQSPLEIPRNDKGQIDKKAFESGRWYRDGKSVWYYDGKNTYTPQEYMRQFGSTIPQSDEGSDEDENADAVALAGMDDDDDDNGEDE